MLPRRALVVIATFLLAFLLYVDRVCISTAKEPIAAELGLTDGQFGWVLSAFAFGYALLQTPSGMAADRLGARRILATIVTLWSIFTGLTALAWNFGSLLVIRFLFGSGEAGAFPGMARAVYSWIPARERGLVKGINFSASRLGAAVTMPLLPMLGSECYIPALDYISAPGPHKNWRFAFERQWLFYAVWGRLLYDSATPNRVFAALLEERFGPGLGDDLLQAWKLASQMPLHFASFYRGTWDGALYTEGFSSWIDKDDGARTFFGIDEFIKHPVLDTKRYLNIADFVKAGGVAGPGVFSPLALAAQLDRDGAEAARRVAAVRAKAKPSPTLECELTDIEAWVAYGSYFAEKLRGGVALATARAKNDAKQQADAVAALERALGHWEHLAALGGKFNQLPVLSSARAPFSWAALTPAVKQDIELARRPLGAR